MRSIEVVYKATNITSDNVATTSELLIIRITSLRNNAIVWKSELIGNCDLKHSELPMIRITNFRVSVNKVRVSVELGLRLGLGLRG